MNTAEDILRMFLRVVTEYDYLDYTEEELTEDFNANLEMALLDVQFQGVMEDVTLDDFGQFTRPLKRQEGYILAHACAVMWVTPKVQSSELLAAQLTSTDFVQFSNANRLNACLKLLENSQAKLNNLITDFTSLNVYTSMRKQIEDGKK